MSEQKKQNISEKLLDYMHKQNDKNTMQYYQDHWFEMGFGSQQGAEMAFYQEQESRTDAAPTQSHHEAKNPYSSAIAAKRAANSRKPMPTTEW